MLRTRTHAGVFLKSAVLPITLIASVAQANDPLDIEELARRQQVLGDEVAGLREALSVPESAELKSVYGLGPAASKVYGVARGVSLGGYGETNLSLNIDNPEGTRNTFDYLRAVFYIGYKFTERIVFNSEIEFEHATTSGSRAGSASVEFATLDFLLHPMANVRAGLLLVPVGLVNEIHEPPFYHGNVRPVVESRLIPSTWRANGAGLFGELIEGLSYRAYLVTSLDAAGFSSAGLRGGRQKGNRELAEHFSFAGRLDYEPTHGVLVGASAFVGNQGQHQPYTDNAVDADAFLQLYEAHAQVRLRGLELRGLASVARLGSSRVLSEHTGESVAKRMLGYYAEAAYDLLPILSPDSDAYLAPWVRYGRLDTQAELAPGLTPNRARDGYSLEGGITVKPIPDVVIKADLRRLWAADDSETHEVRLGFGYVF